MPVTDEASKVGLIQCTEFSEQPTLLLLFRAQLEDATPQLGSNQSSQFLGQSAALALVGALVENETPEVLIIQGTQFLGQPMPGALVAAPVAQHSLQASLVLFRVQISEEPTKELRLTPTSPLDVEVLMLRGCRSSHTALLVCLDRCPDDRSICRRHARVILPGRVPRDVVRCGMEPEL